MADFTTEERIVFDSFVKELEALKEKYDVCFETEADSYVKCSFDFYKMSEGKMVEVSVINFDDLYVQNIRKF